MIRGTTTLIAHFGDPIAPVKAPMIYNPYFESAGIDAVVVPMGVRAADYPVTLKAVFRFTNIRGALVTMPHKVTTVGLLDDCSTTVKVAGSCNAILRRDDGTLHGDLFDGAGFVRGVERKGFPLRGARCLVVGTGGVGSAIAAALAAAGVGTIALYDNNAEGRDGLAKRLRQHYPSLEVRTDTRDPSGFDLVVNGTPLGMNAADPLPIDVYAPVAEDVRRRSRDEAGDHAAAACRARARLHDADRHGHAVRADSAVPRVLRLRSGDRRGASRRRNADLTPGPARCDAAHTHTHTWRKR